MSTIRAILEALRLAAEVVGLVKETRAKNVNDALNGYASGRAAHEASKNAGGLKQ